MKGKRCPFTNKERGAWTPGKGHVLIISHPPACLAQGVLKLNLDLPKVTRQDGEQHTDQVDQVDLCEQHTDQAHIKNMCLGIIFPLWVKKTYISRWH